MVEPSDARVSRLWQAVQEGIADVAAHELKDVLNGVTLNLEVIRSRTAEGQATDKPVGSFATAASEQLEILGARVEAMLYLTRPPRDPADIGAAVRHLGALLIPAARAAGGALTVEGADRPVETPVPARIVRLALAAPLLAMVRAGGAGRCRVDPGSGGSETVVRFSHESAGALDPDPQLFAVIGDNSIQVRRSATDLSLLFPVT